MMVNIKRTKNMVKESSIDFKMKLKFIMVIGQMMKKMEMEL